MGGRSDPLTEPPARPLYVLHVGLGVAAWVLPWLLSGRPEAWHHWSYFVLCLPLMSAAAAYAGYRTKIDAWRWPLTLILAQNAAALVVTGELALVAIVVLALAAAPMMVAAALGAWLGRRKARTA